MIYKFTRWNYFDFWYLFAPLMEYTVYFVFTVVVVYALKHQINQKRVLDSTMDELRIRKLNLETTNRKLHETMEALEEMTVLKERNRIAREIHDTVGHTLTTVLIEIEAGKRLMQKKPDLAEEKLELAQEQVRKGLNDIRKSVRMLKEGSDLMTFIPSIHSLIEETEKHTGVSVKCIFADLPKMSAEQEKLLYRALQEGLTNGIRHGHGTEFEFTLEICDGRLYFILKDNGDGFDHITLGFGLTVMKERVKELDGNFDIFSQKGQGCCLRIDIPVKKEIVYESYSNSYSG
ncbi:MAG: sensor histidine kinase [Clostridia bacterium]|nr:sensor histidine kinase [Clostridia bacterium]